MPPGPPLPYRKSDLTPNIGFPDSSDDQRGGLGADGLRELAKFVDAGGVLITEGASAMLFPASGITPGIAIDQESPVFAPGSVIKTLARDRTSPILYGYDQNAIAVFFKNGPVFRVDRRARCAAAADYGGIGGGSLTPMASPPRLTTLDGPAPTGRWAAALRGLAGPWGSHIRFGGAALERCGALTGAGGVWRRGCNRPPRVILSFPDDPNDLLLSGELVGGEALAGRPALIDQSVGRGHVIMFACRPFWRYQTQGDFFLAFNAILNWNHLDTGR